MSERVLLIKVDKPAGGSQRLSCSEPIGLCYLAAVLKRHGIPCRLLHLMSTTANDELRSTITDYQPTLVGFSVRNFNFNISCDYIRQVRSVLPDARIAIGGECISSDNALCLAKKADADLTVIGDGEESLVAYLNSTAPDEISGIVFRDRDGTHRRSLCATRRVDVARLPMMNRDDLPMNRYSAEAFPSKAYATIHAQRGCRYRCTFCHTAFRYKTPQSRSADQILQELDHLTVRFGVEALAIWDEDFFSDPARVEAIAEGLLLRGSPVQWHSYMKLTDLRNPAVRRILPLLQSSGYVRCVIGLESFIPATLRHYHKAGGPNVEERLQILTGHGIRICPSYIIGEPHETYDLIQYGLHRLLMLRESGIAIDLPYVSFLVPFPDTPLHDEYARRGLILDENWDHYDGENVVVRCECPPEQLAELRDDFYRNFYGAACPT